MKLLFIINLLLGFNTYGLSFKEIQSFERYITRQEPVEQKKIHMTQEIKLYLEQDINYKKKELERQFSRDKYNPLFNLIPRLEYTLPDSKKPISNRLNLQWNIGSIWEDFFSFIASPEVERAGYDLKQYKQNLALKIQNLIKKFLELASEIRGEYEVYLYLLKELEKKEGLYAILEQDDLNDLFTLRHNILDTLEKLYKLNNELDIFVLENKEYFTKEKIGEILILFFMDISDISYSAYVIKYESLPQVNLFFALINNLPIKVFFNINMPLHTLYQEGNQENWSITINPAEYAKYAMQTYYQRKQSTIEKNHLQKQWQIQSKIHKDKQIFYMEKLSNIEKTLNFMEQILENEEMLQSIRPKHVWEHRSNLIRKKEERKLIQLLIIIHNLVVFV